MTRHASQTSAASSTRDASGRVLLLAPTVQDAAFCSRILHEHGIPTFPCRSLSELCLEVAEGDGAAALIAEEFLVRDRYEPLAQVLAQQPPWSDFPLVVFLSAGNSYSEAVHRLQSLGNVTLVTRPVRIATFINTIHAKLRDRTRQYTVRDLLIRRAEDNAMMKRHERRLAMALEAGGMAVWEWRPDELYWSEGLFDLLELSHHTTPSIERLLSRVHPSDRNQYNQAWGRSIRRVESFSHEFRVVLPSGKTKWLASIGDPVCDEAGRLVQICGLSWDITEAKRTELRRKRHLEADQFLAQATLELSSSLDYPTALRTVTQICVSAFSDWAILDLVGDDGAVTRSNVAHRDPDQHTLASVIIRYPPRRGTSADPTSRALDGGPSVLISDLAANVLTRAALNQEHGQALRQMKPRSCIVVPLVARGMRFGTLTLLLSEGKRRFTRRDLHTAEELARRASVAIDNAKLYLIGQQASAAKSEFVANMSHE
ncbi:MAG: PAS domain-containing protein, partial [Planctomycetaceae bacterium]